MEVSRSGFCVDDDDDDVDDDGANDPGDNVWYSTAELTFCAAGAAGITTS